jgi:hypothetical protein
MLNLFPFFCFLYPYDIVVLDNDEFKINYEAKI